MFSYPYLMYPGLIYLVPMYRTRQQFPPFNTTHFFASANEIKQLMNDAHIVLNKLSTSKQFDKQVMNAAQKSDEKEVKRLIKSLNIKSIVDVKFNPDYLQLRFRQKTVENVPACCSLTLALKWS
ncbi:hypothetical protein [Virgibacillus proomii]|uniref:hypothetical protein n=1 Tax=Virgibacillus proomii TaxID=84407 RepID=UPI001C109237|nr:hypothetical protein [Virgibacillus proomii]MBU5266448.1 hypothetical protein [Virgibacillus proomii]